MVIGASAGGVEALKTVVAGLPADLPAAICVVLHIAPTSSSALAGILDRAGDLPCRSATDGDRLHPGRILVAPPDHHLVVQDGLVRLTTGPRENGHRPSVDALFRSAAHARTTRVVGVVLSGTRDDGSAGLATIRSRGGLAVVQDPADALYPGMPRSALAHGGVDAVAPLHGVADAIVALVTGIGAPPHLEHRPTLMCPECGGVLSERDEEGDARWRCRLGHAYSSGDLAEAQGGVIEAALHEALRGLEERAALLRRLAEQSDTNGRPRSAAVFGHQAEQAQHQADLVRSVARHAALAAHRGLDAQAAGEPNLAGRSA